MMVRALAVALAAGAMVHVACGGSSVSGSELARTCFSDVACEPGDPCAKGATICATPTSEPSCIVRPAVVTVGSGADLQIVVDVLEGTSTVVLRRPSGEERLFARLGNSRRFLLTLSEAEALQGRAQAIRAAFLGTVETATFTHSSTCRSWTRTSRPQS